MGSGFNFRETPKSRFWVVVGFFLFAFFLNQNHIVHSFKPVFPLCLLFWCWDRDFSACFQVIDTVDPDYMLLQKFPHMNFSELYFYVCTLLDCLL